MATRLPTEIIVVDDASTDSTAAIISELKTVHANLRYVRLEENVGPGVARNFGLEYATGEFVGFLDADDVFPPGALDLLLNALVSDSSIDIAMGRVQALRPQDDSESLPDFSPAGDSLRCYQLGTILARRSVFENFGTFDTVYRHGEDIDWFFRIQEEGAKFSIIDDIVVLHREHAHNMSKDLVRGMPDIARVMHASLQRRRKIGALSGKAPEEIYYVKPDRLSV